MANYKKCRLCEENYWVNESLCEMFSYPQLWDYSPNCSHLCESVPLPHCHHSPTEKIEGRELGRGREWGGRLNQLMRPRVDSNPLSE